MCAIHAGFHASVSRIISRYRIVETLGAQAKTKRTNWCRNSSKYVAAKSYFDAFPGLVPPRGALGDDYGLVNLLDSTNR
jgi:hypothetical protein